MTLDTIRPEHFDTAGLPEAESLALCLATLADVGGALTLDADSVSGWRGVRCLLPQLAVMTCFFPPLPVGIVAAGKPAPDRTLLMVRSMEGPLIVRQAGREIEVAAGDFLFVSGEQAYEWILPEGGRLDFGSLPASAFRMPATQLGRILLRPVPKSFPPLQLLITYGAYLLMRGPHAVREADMANVHFNEILPLVVAYLDEDAVGSGANDRLRSVKTYIDRNLSDSDLDVSTLAELSGVTPRSIQKLFQQEGTTFSRYLLEKRLAAARSMLGRGDDERPISTIAYDVGFGDLSYFNKAFRRHFGHAPSDLRKTGGRG